MLTLNSIQRVIALKRAYGGDAFKESGCFCPDERSTPRSPDPATIPPEFRITPKGKKSVSGKKPAPGFHPKAKGVKKKPPTPAMTVIRKKK
jgi:hypothetical protein